MSLQDYLASYFITIDCFLQAHVAQSVEHILGKDEVTSSILVVGFKKFIRKF